LENFRKHQLRSQVHQEPGRRPAAFHRPARTFQRPKAASRGHRSSAVKKAGRLIAGGCNQRVLIYAVNSQVHRRPHQDENTTFIKQNKKLSRNQNATFFVRTSQRSAPSVGYAYLLTFVSRIKENNKRKENILGKEEQSL
jgi:hypothetical protein